MHREGATEYVSEAWLGAVSVGPSFSLGFLPIPAPRFPPPILVARQRPFSILYTLPFYCAFKELTGTAQAWGKDG